MIDVFSYKLGMNRGGGGGESGTNTETVVYYEKGVTPILETINPMDGVYFYKISETAPSVEDLVGCTLVIYDLPNAGGEFTETVTEESLTVTEESITGNGFVSAFTATSYQGVPITAGLWTGEMPDAYPVKLYKQGEINVLPKVTSADDGDMLMVVDGKWVEADIENGNEVAY